MSFNEINKEDLIEDIINAHLSDNHIGKRVLKPINRAKKVSTGSLTKDEFLALIWQQSNGIRIVSPRGKSRSVGDICKRAVQKGYSIDYLTKDQGKPLVEHKPKWFDKCIKIYDSFDYKQFDTLLISEAKPNEIKYNSTSKYYIQDGVHRCFVLGLLIAESKVPYNPIDAILIE